MDFSLVEHTRIDRLYNENSLQHAAINQRHSNEGLEWILAGLTEILETGMISRLLYGNGSNLFGDESRQTFMKSEPQHANALFAKTQRCGEDEMRSIRLQKIRRAHIGSEALRNQRYDIHQSFGGLASLLCQVRQFFQCEHIVCCAFCVAHADQTPFRRSVKGRKTACSEMCALSVAWERKNFGMTSLTFRTFLP